MKFIWDTIMHNSFLLYIMIVFILITIIKFFINKYKYYKIFKNKFIFVKLVGNELSLKYYCDDEYYDETLLIKGKVNLYNTLSQLVLGDEIIVTFSEKEGVIRFEETGVNNYSSTEIIGKLIKIDEKDDYIIELDTHKRLRTKLYEYEFPKEEIIIIGDTIKIIRETLCEEYYTDTLIERII